MLAFLVVLKAEHAKWIAFTAKVPKSVFGHLTQGLSAEDLKASFKIFCILLISA